MPTTRTSAYLLLEDWEAVPLAAPLRKAEEARSIKRPWSPVRVPGHWQLDEAFVACEGRVLYRCWFEGQAPCAAEMASLRFGGVYYSARVWLNGAYLGDHEGYFGPFEFDCTDAMVEGENELLVEVYSPEEPDENDRRTIGGVWARWDGMNPHINPGGIFRDVALLYGGEVRVRSLGVRADPSGRGQVFVDLYARREAQVKLIGLIRPLGFEAPGSEFEVDAWVEPGLSRLEVDFFLPQPRLWWTWDRGEQPLYELVFRCCAGEERRVRFGVRSVELRGWKMYLNGRRVFPRGINSVPTDAYPARASEERLRADAALVREANLNAVRVHAHVAEEGFYTTCDELGVLVFQDFPLQWTHRRRVFGPAVRQAGEMARGLRGHPCVGVYLAHNEPFYVIPPEKWTVLGLARTTVESLAPRWALWQRRVLGPAVVGALVEEDPSRAVIEAAGHPRTTNHLYFGWYYGRFRDLGRVVKFLSGIIRLPTEYGVQALPASESLKEIWPEGREPDWDALSRNYRFQAVRMRRYVSWKGDRVAYIRDSQTYQARALKYVTELLRRRKYRPTGGAFAFMLNDPAPAISWSVTDWRRRPKAAYEVLAAAMRPVLVCVECPRDSYRLGRRISLSLFAVNDLSRGLGWVRWSWVLGIEGTGISRGSGEAEIGPDSVVRIGRIRSRLSISGRATLQLRLDGEGVETSNIYDFLVEDDDRLCRGLSVLERVTNVLYRRPRPI